MKYETYRNIKPNALFMLGIIFIAIGVGKINHNALGFIGLVMVVIWMIKEMFSNKNVEYRLSKKITKKEYDKNVKSKKENK